MTTTYVPRNDLSAFVEGISQASSLADTVNQLQHEIDGTAASFSRDSRIRFEQLRYLNSLKRVATFLRSGVVPPDLTPRERLAIRGLSHRITKNVPATLVSAFGQVTLPAGTFGESFEVLHRLAS